MTLLEQSQRAAGEPAEVRERRGRGVLRAMQRLSARQRRRRELEHCDLGGEAGAA